MSGFMRTLDLERYIPGLNAQGINTLSDLHECNPTLEDLRDELGVDKLLHRKRLRTALSQGVDKAYAGMSPALKHAKQMNPVKTQSDEDDEALEVSEEA